MKLASLLNNFLLCCTYRLLSEFRQWSKNRSERRQFCVLLGQIQSGGRKTGRQSFLISMEANGKQFHQRPQRYGTVRDLRHSSVLLCKKAALQTARQQGGQREWAGGDEVMNPWWFLQYLQPCKCDIPRATHLRRSELRVNQPPRTPTAPNIAPSSRRQRIMPCAKALSCQIP